jgi:MraZ protein
MSATSSNVAIFYHSTYRHGVDEKRRVQIPSKWRPNEQDVELTIILWTDNAQQGSCLRVLPRHEMEEMISKIKPLSSAEPETVALRRNIAKRSDTATMDKAGRICIPDWMAKAAGIEKEAVLAGALQWFEIWNPDRYSAISSVDEALSPEAFKKI